MLPETKGTTGHKLVYMPEVQDYMLPETKGTIGHKLVYMPGKMEGFAPRTHRYYRA